MKNNDNYYTFEISPTKTKKEVWVGSSQPVEVGVPKYKIDDQKPTKSDLPIYKIGDTKPVTKPVEKMPEIRIVDPDTGRITVSADKTMPIEIVPGRKLVDPDTGRITVPADKTMPIEIVPGRKLVDPNSGRITVPVDKTMPVEKGNGVYVNIPKTGNVQQKDGISPVEKGYITISPIERGSGAYEKRSVDGKVLAVEKITNTPNNLSAFPIDGELKVVEAAIDENVSMQQRSASEFGDLKDNVQKNFSSLYNINKMTKGLNGLKKRTVEIADAVDRISMINKKHLNNFVEIDRNLANKIDQIEISHDFAGNNSLKTNSYNKVILEKVDGKSVNAGAKTTEQQKYDDNSSIASKHVLTDITKDATVAQHAKDITGINTVNLGNIANNNENVQQHAKDIEGINGVALGDISNGNDTVQQHAEEIKGIDGVALGDISNGNNTVQQHIEEIKGIDNVLLAGINNANDTIKQEINNNYRVEGQVNLSNINNNNSAGPKVEFDVSRF